MLEKYLCDDDFVDIKFIDYELRWLTANEFVRHGITIKRIYQNMKDNQKQIYKWYCYANIHTNMYQKNKIWDYLNGDINYAEVKTSLSYDGKNYKTKEER